MRFSCRSVLKAPCREQTARMAPEHLGGYPRLGGAQQGLQPQGRLAQSWSCPGDCVCKRGQALEKGVWALGRSQGAADVPRRPSSPEKAHPRSGAGSLHRRPCVRRPTRSWRAWPVFVIVALAPGQAWPGASPVGTVCTVSAGPSLSSCAINFFFFLIW